MERLSLTEDYGDEMFGNLNMSSLNRDGAYVNVSSTLGSISYLYSVYKECYKCPYTEEFIISSNRSHYIDTTYKKLWRVMLNNPVISSQNSRQDVLCEFEPELGEFGVYSLEVSKTGCNFQILKQPVNIYVPLLTAVVLYAFIFILFRIGACCYNTVVKKEVSTDFNEKLKHPKRLRSIDTFRGICIAAMIFVNYGCGGYVVLDHAIWNGIRVADFIYPSFIWIMGFCISITAFSTATNKPGSKFTFANILKRSSILFLLGVLNNVMRNRTKKVRVLGVLQKFGVSYFVTASITAACSKNFSKSFEMKRRSTKFTDVLAIKYHWACAASLTVLHTLLIMFLEVPNCPRGYLGPGGYHEDGKNRGCTAGVSGYIDKLILGNNIFVWPTTHQIYDSESYESQGILSHVTGIVLVITGIQAGAISVFHKTHFQRIIRWLVWGTVLLVIGGVLCSFSKEDGLIPINRQLWSISFICVTSGFAFITFTLCYYIIDVQAYWTGKPFLFAGMNAIIVYMGHHIFEKSIPFRWVIDGKIINTTHLLTVLENFWGVGLWLLVAYCLFRINFFLNI